ncbi:hypothetical protein EMPS_05443 [Entomortierella parvispora]|uniref:Ricin B lectin domain-containing protein n=1 Tax=Entomortierella parvispora TaxID=205924 RepID=A0A9P3HAR8_9FUNG|nr:hypothetical protein EMPS_05443 [Entomortierella parvispora]
MSRSLPSLLLSFLILTLICLQGVFGSINEGLYIIHTLDNKYLAIGPVPPIYPPLDVPARVLPSAGQDRIWEVLRAEDGGYTIRQRGDSSMAYGLNQNEDGAVIVSAMKKPQNWAIDNAGDDLFTIRVVNEDSLVTVNRGEFPPVVLRPANGSPEQRWVFIPIPRFSDTHGGMYGKSRFNLQCGL